MKNINLVILLTLLLTACSTKSTTTTPDNCQNIQNEIDNLKKENYIDVAAVTLKTVTGRYSYGGEEKHLDQKIKILELELSECKRRVN